MHPEQNTTKKLWVIILVTALGLRRWMNTVGQGLRFSRYDRKVEVIKLFIIWLMNFKRKEQNYRSGSRQFTSGDARVYRFIHRLKPGAKLHSQWTLRIPLKTHISLREKWLSQPQKGILVLWCHNLMGDFFGLLWRSVNAYRKDRKCFKIVQTNGLSVKENTNASECTAQNNSIFAFAFDSISSPTSFWDLWMSFSSLVNF